LATILTLIFAAQQHTPLFQIGTTTLDTNTIYQYNAEHYKLSAGQRQERLDRLFIVLNIAALYRTTKKGILETLVCNGHKTSYNVDNSS